MTSLKEGMLCVLNLYVYVITLLDPLRSLKQEAGTKVPILLLLANAVDTKTGKTAEAQTSKQTAPRAASSGFHQGPHPSRPLGGGRREGRGGAGLDSCTIVLIPWSAGASLRLRSLPDSLYPTPAPESLKVHMSPHPGGHRKAKEVSCVRNELFRDKALSHSPAWPQDRLGAQVVVSSILLSSVLFLLRWAKCVPTNSDAQETFRQ